MYQCFVVYCRVLPRLRGNTRVDDAVQPSSSHQDPGLTGRCCGLPIFLPGYHPPPCCVSGPESHLLVYCLANWMYEWLWPKLTKGKLKEEGFVLAHVWGYGPPWSQDMAKFEAACSCLRQPGSRDGTCRLSPMDFSFLYSVWNCSLWDNSSVELQPVGQCQTPLSIEVFSAQFAPSEISSQTNRRVLQSN